VGPVWQRAPMRRFSVIFVLLAGCPSSAPPLETTPDPEPEPGIVLDGQVLYERSLEAAPESVRTGWSAFEAAWSNEPPMPSDEPSVAEYRDFASDELAPYAEAQVSTAIQLIQLGESAQAPEARLVLSVLAARLLHRGASWLWTLPLPAEAEANPAARASLEQSMRGAAQNLAQYAREAFGECIAVAEATPAFEPWRADCALRAEALEPIRTAQIGPPPPTPMPEGCEDHTDPVFASPQHDPDARPQLLVLVEAETEGVDEDALRQAVERWARSEHELRAVPAVRRRAAEALVAAGKTSRRGVACAAAPSLSWVLGARIEHLVVARYTHQCSEETPMNSDLEPTGPPRIACAVHVSWSRAGSRNPDGLPPARSIRVPTDADTAAIIEALTQPPDDSRVVGSLSSMMEGRGRMRLAAVDGGSGYRLRSAVDELEVGECQAERGASQLQLAWTVTPTGAVESVTVAGGDDAVNACVKDKLEQLSLSCTPGGEPVEMQTTLCLAR